MKTTMPTLYPVMDILTDTHDTKTFRLGLPADVTLGMFPGDYLSVHVMIDSKYGKVLNMPSLLSGASGFIDLTVEHHKTGII
jgi:ferredoxin-NADP reductase